MYAEPLGPPLFPVSRPANPACVCEIMAESARITDAGKNPPIETAGLTRHDDRLIYY